MTCVDHSRKKNREPGLLFEPHFPSRYVLSLCPVLKNQRCGNHAYSDKETRQVSNRWNKFNVCSSTLSQKKRSCSRICFNGCYRVTDAALRRLIQLNERILTYNRSRDFGIPHPSSEESATRKNFRAGSSYEGNPYQSRIRFAA